MTDQRYEALVIGSGFGGAITGCRLAAKWPNEVIVLERGRRYPRGSFARTPEDMAKNLWSVEAGEQGMTDLADRGLFDYRKLGRMDAVVAAGLGGGSLVYSNVFLEPPSEVFDDARWPASCDAGRLAPYYEVARRVLGARPVPRDQGTRQIRRTDVFAAAAAAMDRVSTPADVNVFFGSQCLPLLPPGTRATNAYGVTQTSCTYCGECNIGCNLHAKNTLDLNYLHRAERTHGATITTGHQVESIVPLNADGDPDPSVDGTHGYRVSSRDLDTGDVRDHRTNRVVVAAGTLGSVELLLRSRDVSGTLPRLTDSLGQGFSGNGDFLLFVLGIPQPTDPDRGPVITQYIDHGLFADARADGFVMEDSAYPVLLAWLAEGAMPMMKLRAASVALRRVFARMVLGRSGGVVGSRLASLLDHGITKGSAVLLCMGRDSSTGTLHLDRTGRLDGCWPRQNNRNLYRSILAAAVAFRDASGGRKVFAVPTWWLPFRRNLTVHALGGCRLAEDRSSGVVSSRPSDFGRVFNYQNLYVADGSIIPAAVGANPSATISALAERVAHGITGLWPTSEL